MNQETKNFIIARNKAKLNLPDNAEVAMFYHVTATKNVKKILRQGFRPNSWFAVSENDLENYKRQVQKPYVMVCWIRLDGIVPSGDYFTSQTKLVQQTNGIWIPQ